MRAYLSLDTGQFYWRSDVTGDDELPEDLDESDRYIPVPYKHELDLGRDLVIGFTEQEIPGELDRVWDFFGRSGAYRRFKDLLEYRWPARKVVRLRKPRYRTRTPRVV